MIKPLLYLFNITLLLVLTGCIEIIDDVSLNDDGSGTFKYNINLSSSKVKINSILSLDSLDGRKVPKITDIESQVIRVVEELKAQKGITNVTFEADYIDYMFKLKCDFASLEDLQSAIKQVIIFESKAKDLPELDHDWISFEDNTLKRSVPKITIAKSKEINQKEIDLLKEGTYTSITRFEQEIVDFENDKAIVSKNNKAIMVRTDPYSLTQNPNLLDNSINLVKKAE
mgnify:CR=1 FL=1